MSGSILNIISAIKAGDGLASPTNFTTTITAPLKLNDNLNSRNIRTFCNESTLPGVAFENERIRHKGIGPQELRPVDINFNPVELMFYCDNVGTVENFFHKWMNLIYNFGNIQNPSSNRPSLNIFSYPDDYVGTTTITKFKPDGKVSKSYILERSWPVTLGDVKLSWDATDQILVLPVTMTYTRWETTDFSEI